VDCDQNLQKTPRDHQQNDETLHRHCTNQRRLRKWNKKVRRDVIKTTAKDALIYLNTEESSIVIKIRRRRLQITSKIKTVCSTMTTAVKPTQLGFPVSTHEAERNARELHKRRGLFAVVTNAATLHDRGMQNDPFCAYSVFTRRRTWVSCAKRTVCSCHQCSKFTQLVDAKWSTILYIQCITRRRTWVSCANAWIWNKCSTTTQNARCLFAVDKHAATLHIWGMQNDLFCVRGSRRQCYTLLTNENRSTKYPDCTPNGKWRSSHLALQVQYISDSAEEHRAAFSAVHI